MQHHQGIGAADGIAIGKAVCISTRIGDIYQIPVPEAELDEELRRFDEAVALTRAELRSLGERVGQEIGDELSGIFDAQELFLADKSFLDRVREHIRAEHVHAEWALQETLEEFQDRFAEIDTLHLRERGEDLGHVCRYVIRHLRGIHLHQLSEVEGDVIIVADDLSPSDAVRLGRENVIAFVIEHGSRTSHTTIIARSLSIPAVVAVGDGVRERLLDHAEVPVIVDGSSGKVIVEPDGATLADYERRRSELDRREAALLSDGALKAVTRDDAAVRVMANIDLPEEIEDARRYGAAGIGLYRSEFLYIEKSPSLPSEDEHLEIYRRLIEAAAPEPAVIRTYDLGGRKIAREVLETHEANPVLGLRGIRLTLARKDIFATQIRGLLRASLHGEVWIMLPLVTFVEEVRDFRDFVAEVMEELDRDGVEYGRRFKLGIMIEVPAAALITDILAREVDFFSIGTNDLIQYALAVDRNNEHVADLYRPLHPGMLRMLTTICSNARQAGIEVSLCGETAADTSLTAVLLGCGLRRLSVSPRKIPTLKRRIRELTAAPLAEIVDAGAQLATAAEVQEHLRQELGDLVRSEADLAEPS